MKLGSQYLITVAILLFIFSGLASAQSNPTITKVESFSGYIRVEWQVKSETGVDHYEVWRSSGSSEPYLIEVVARGIHYYEDRKLYKTEDQFFGYQVKAIGANQSIQGQSDVERIRFMSTSSTAKRTWGSIKAMFR